MGVVKKIFEKHMLLYYVIRTFLYSILISALFFGAAFASLKISGKYSTFESMLDLKYDSPWIIVPLVIAAILAVLSFIIGLILYLYKYKRKRSRSDFFRALSGILNKNEKLLLVIAVIFLALDGFLLPDQESFFVEVRAAEVVLPQELVITPEETWIYYGQKIPNFTYIMEPPVEEEIDLTIGIDCPEDKPEIGEYNYTIISDNPNYNIKIADGCKFEVKEYITDEVAIAENETDIYHAGSITLYAPSGYSISVDKYNFSSDFVIVNAEESTEDAPNEISYYLRNESEYNGAISQELKYQYYCDRKPEIVTAEIRTAVSDGKLNFEDFGIVTNDNILLTVTARGTDVDCPTVIYLSYGGKTEEMLVNTGTDSNGIYFYKAEFSIEVPKNSAADFELTAYAGNDFGESGDEKLKLTDAYDNFVENYENQNRIILDKIIPTEPEIAIIYNNQKEYVEARGVIRDIESGVNKIEYKWDFFDENKLIQYGDNSNSVCQENDQDGSFDYTNEPDGMINFHIRVNYDDIPVETYPCELTLRITDNAGNVGLYEYCDSESGRDTEAPEIIDIGFRKKGTVKFDDTVKFLPFGNYAGEDIELVVVAQDISETIYLSGIRDICLFDGENSEYDTQIQTTPSNSYITDNGETAYEYLFDIPLGTSIDDLMLQLSDTCDMMSSFKVSELIAEMKQNSLIVEAYKPKVDFLICNSLNNSVSVYDAGFIYNSDGRIWYNEEDGEKLCEDYDGNFVIVVDDAGGHDISSGLNSVVIYETDKDGASIEIANVEYDEFVTQKGFSFSSSDLESGEYHYRVEVVDNAGNRNEAELTIYIDKESPNGKIFVEQPDAKEFDGKKWFDQDELITFRVDIESDASDIEKVLLIINGQLYEYGGSQISVVGDAYYVLISTDELTPIENQNPVHRYEIEGNITDTAGNVFVLSPLIVYVDCESPLINRLTVEKKSSAIDRIVNVLPFGTFSNDTLIIRAYVSDTDQGSGVKSVKIMYDGLSEEKEMTDEGNGIYSWEISTDISADVRMFQSDIWITACDRFGKETTECPNIEGAKQGSGVSDNVFVMMETDAPEVSIIEPKDDDIVQIEDQIWINSDKEISVSVYDRDSGIRNVDIKVNGISVTADQNGVDIPGISTTERAGSRDNERHIYIFDTDYFCEIAGEPEDGRYIVTVEATDNAGNVHPMESFTYYIDNISPSVDGFEFVPGTSDNIGGTSEYIDYLEYGFFFKRDFAANIRVADGTPSSGLDRLEYRLVSYDNGARKEETTGEIMLSGNTASINIPAGFKGQIFVRAFDKVGNYSDEITVKAFVVDDRPPEINISEIGDSGYRDGNGNKLFTDDFTVTVTITDTKSGIREVGYQQTAEKDGFERKVVRIAGTAGGTGTEIEDGWIVSGKDANLITQITKTFAFNKDNNDIILTFDAVDNSDNMNGAVKSETFTIDKTDPVINVNLSSGVDDTVYYNKETKATITIDVVERNFDAGLIQTTIENTFNGNVPGILFQELSVTDHRAIVVFGEGDYSFDIKGNDLGGRPAQINIDYERVKRFYVDETAPIIEGNFTDFISDGGNYFNEKKTAVINVAEHNFDPILSGLKILRKDAGKEHNEKDFVDVTYMMTNLYDWSDNNDTHMLSVQCDQDAIYRIEISPSDPAGNHAKVESTGIFEIDTTPPALVSVNGISVDGKNAVDFLHMYPYERKDEASPTVEFMDINFDHIKYGLTEYTPEYTNGKELIKVEPKVVYLDSDESKSGMWNMNLFTLPDFTKDGVYALELVAVDKAGNESALNSNTYMRMVNSDVLAYISNSNAAEKTGWYSFQYENGEPISKRPDNFSDIEIVVLAKNDSDIDIVLRDYNGDEKNTELQAESDDHMYGVGVYTYILSADYFKDNFQEDTDVELYLSVKNEGRRIDLGRMHIDNIPPYCSLSDEFKSWHWFVGNDSRIIIITEISELLNETECKVYDNGEEIDFVYAGEDRSLSFVLDRGWHNVGVKLEDVAGNVYSIPEVCNIHVGYFWVKLGIAVMAVICIIIFSVIFFQRMSHKKKA